MSNFKAVAMDYEYYLTLLDEGQLYCLTERQIYILLVQLEYVGWLTRWYNTDDITQTTVDLIKSELMEKLMSCVDISILVDQAALNLVDSTTSKQIESQALRDILEDMYDGNPTSVNPSAPTTNFGSTGDRYDALCAGLMAFVYQFARAQADSARAAQIGGLAAVALVALLLIPGLNFFFVVGASIAVAAGLGTIGVSLEVAIAALTDTTALDAVVCYMRDTLRTQSVTEANWTACLNSYPFGVGTHEAIICDFIKPMLAANYLTILNILGQAYDGTINGDVMPECPCEPDEWIKDIFTGGNQHSWVAQASYAAFSNGWTDGSTDNIQIGIKKPFTGQTITAMRVYFDVGFVGAITMQSLGNYNSTGFVQMTKITDTMWEISGMTRSAGIFLNFVNSPSIVGHKIIEIWYKIA
jgi:hypothetical protein